MVIKIQTLKRRLILEKFYYRPVQYKSVNITFSRWSQALTKQPPRPIYIYILAVRQDQSLKSTIPFFSFFSGNITVTLERLIIAHFSSVGRSIPYTLVWYSRHVDGIKCIKCAKKANTFISLLSFLLIFSTRIPFLLSESPLGGKMAQNSALFLHKKTAIITLIIQINRWKTPISPQNGLIHLLGHFKHSESILQYISEQIGAEKMQKFCPRWGLCLL